METSPTASTSNLQPFSLVSALLLAIGILLFTIHAYLWGTLYSPDSYAYLLLGKAIWNGAGFQSDAIRDFFLSVGTISSRSFPPLWPFLVGALESVFGVHSGAVWNGLITACLLWTLYHLGERVSRGSGVGLSVLLLHPGYLQESISGRSMPLTLLLVSTALLLLLDSRAELRHGHRAFAAGICLGGALLVRFDQLPLVGLLPLVLLWPARHPQRRLSADPEEIAQADRADSRRKGMAFLLAGSIRRERLGWVLLAYLGAGLAFLPWAARNFRVFGTPLASDSSISALALVDEITQMTWWESGRPPLVWDDPAGWIRMRLGFALRNAIQLLIRPATLSYISVMVLGLYLGVKQKSFQSWGRAGLLALMGCVPLLFQTLTPYQGIRYTVIACLLWALAIILAWSSEDDRAEGTRFSQKTLWVWVLVSLMIGLLSLRTGEFRARATAAQVRQLQAQLEALGLGRVIRESGQRVASNDAEALTYLLGWSSIYLPRNCRPGDAAFRSWMIHWRPRYLLFPQEWESSLPKTMSVRHRVAEGLLLVDGCELVPETCRNEQP